MEFFKNSEFFKFDEGAVDAHLIAEYCNERLSREGKVVYGVPEEGCGWYEERRPSLHFHKALLINIEPIKKCKHESGKVYYVFSEVFKLEDNWKCECGAKVRPIAFEEIK